MSGLRTNGGKSLMSLVAKLKRCRAELSAFTILLDGNTIRRLQAFVIPTISAGTLTELLPAIQSSSQTKRPGTHTQSRNMFLVHGTGGNIGRRTPGSITES